VNLALQARYTIQLSPEELNLIGLALCGRLKPEQEEEAFLLNRRLLESKIATLTQHLELATKALESLKEK
jgi:hypothetical protein